MSTTVPHEAASTTDDLLPNLLFDYPGSDIILRSHDSHHFRVPRIYIINSSRILGELIRNALDLPRSANDGASFPVVPLPESGQVLHCLLTIIFPVTPLVSSTPEEFMELLSVAQKYQMEAALTNIRGTIARQNLLPTRLQPALCIYFLAQKYGLHPEALQTARAILKYPITIEDLANELKIMSGSSLYKLYQYFESFQAILASGLKEFRAFRAGGTIIGLHCSESRSSRIPIWLDQYIVSIGKAPRLFDSAEFNIAMARHIKDKANELGCECASIPSKTIRDFWEALASVVHGSFEKVSMVDVQSFEAI
jgi:hypothetical protein